jgi:hypothetical protein
MLNDLWGYSCRYETAVEKIQRKTAGMRDEVRNLLGPGVQDR